MNYGKIKAVDDKMRAIYESQLQATRKTELQPGTCYDFGGAIASAMHRAYELGRAEEEARAINSPSQ